MKVAIREHDLRFERYRYRPSTVHPDGMVRCDEVEEVLPDRMPPEVWTRPGDILCVPPGERDAVIGFAERNHLPVTSRVDVWRALLEPFLDTEISAEGARSSLEHLVSCGLPEEEVASIRARVRRRMLLFNAIHWDWAYLGLFDLLDAFRLLTRRQSYERLYWEAIRIARLGRLQ